MLIVPLLFYLVLTTARLPELGLSVYFFKFLIFLLNCFGVPIQVQLSLSQENPIRD